MDHSPKAFGLAIGAEPTAMRVQETPKPSGRRFAAMPDDLARGGSSAPVGTRASTSRTDGTHRTRHPPSYYEPGRSGVGVLPNPSWPRRPVSTSALDLSP